MLSPEPINATKAAVDDFAERIARQCDFEPGGDIQDVVERLGGQIHYQDLPDWRNTNSGSLEVHGPKDFDIYVSSFTSPLRDRFTIAHELGHYFLHSRQGDVAPMRVERFVSDGNSVSNRVEWEANWFAAGFLMPKAEFRQAHSEFSSFEHLSSYFLVSVQAAEFRAKNLGLE